MKTLFYNAKVYVDRGHFEEAVLQENGIITAVGSSADILALAGDAEKIDCQGRTILPGMNDSHEHLLDFGQMLVMPDIHSCKSVDEIVAVCRDFLAGHPGCKSLVAKGWNESHFNEGEKRLPDRHDMDRISTEIPIVLYRVCCHIAVVNTKMLERAGFRKYHTVDGGKVEWEEDGTPNGRVYENALSAVMNHVPPATPEELAEYLKAGMQYAVAHGLTTVQCNDAGTVASISDVYEALDMVYQNGEAPLRYVSQTGMTNLEDMKAFVEGPLHKKIMYDGMLKCGPIKMFKDGSLGARSSLMRQPYADDPTTVGVERISDAEQLEMIRYANETNTQVVTHCIGDGAIEKTQNLYIQANGGANNPNRHCIIHYQITDPNMLCKTRDHNILVAYQPAFLEYDLHICDERVGKKLGSTSYCFKTAYEMGIHASFGSDCPVEDCNPFCGIYCAVTRMDYNHFPAGGWNPQECITVEDAIDMYTAESAYHEFMENSKGRLKPGYLADLIILDTDIFTCDPGEILHIQPVLTMVNGRIVHRK